MKPIIHSSKIVHENPWYRIRHDELTWPNGRPGEYYVVEIPASVNIVAVKDGKLLIVEQYRYPLGNNSIEFVTGRTDDDEPAAAAARELREETGYIAKNWKPLGTISVLNGVTTQLSHVFIATDLEFVGQELEASEFGLKARWVTIEEWRAMIRRGEIQDSETLSAWALYCESREGKK